MSNFSDDLAARGRCEPSCELVERKQPAIYLDQLEEQALFITESLRALYHALPDDCDAEPVATRFLIGQLTDMGERLADGIDGFLRQMEGESHE